MAGGISRKKGIVTHSEDEDRPRISYCPYCLDFGFREKLGPKLLISNEPKPADYDQWRQCHTCGNIYPIYETKVESKLSDFVEFTDDPFDIGPKIVGIGNKKPTGTRQRERKKILHRIEAEKDEDIKQALRRGNTVETIEDN